MAHYDLYRSHMFESHTHSDLIAALSLKMCVECLVCKEPGVEGGNGQVVSGTKRTGLSCHDARGKETVLQSREPQKSQAGNEMKLWK